MDPCIVGSIALSPSGTESSIAPALPWQRPSPVEHISNATLGCISEIMVLDSQCSILVHKRSLQDLPVGKAHSLFSKHLKAVGKKNLNPFFRDETVDIFFLSENDVFIVAAHPSPQRDTPISTVVRLDFLQRVYETMKDCIGTVNEAYVSVNRMLLFEVLDEIVFGINAGDKSRSQVGSAKSKEKAPNSAYINIVESLSAVLGCDVIAGATHIENPSFHACVDATHLEKRKALRVLPPPGQTRLMIYTLSDPACIRIPILVTSTFTPIAESRDQNLSLCLINQAETRTVASYVRVKVKLPSWVQSISTTKSGPDHTSHFNSDEKTAEWEVKRFHGGGEESILFRLISTSDKSFSLCDVGPISVAFNITHFSASGLVVRMAEVENQTMTTQDPNSQRPECFFGVSTKAASFTVRTDTLIN
ncbi:AP-4 complex subunit mu-1 [Elysia marginata]|uniref:AP-4 complex subunit mu-1 n=1 Tax=Elysia marginata TaxID=1093978 RepID=A0AAV4H3P7_9GAST|nr:AP-4 complex subunit mu-1 [Elysia marginata]